MKKLRILSCASILATALLTGCKGEPEPSKPNEPTKPEEKAPIVFVMSGQSNMEGNTNFGRGNGDTSYLDAAFQTLGITDGDVCKTGIASVKCSYYGNGYGELDHTNYNRNDVHASNTTDKIKGAFFPTKIGMGHTDDMMGPELGLAYELMNEATEDEPIYLVKMASSGSGFAQSGTDYNWLIKDENENRKENNLYDAFLKPFLKNNLDLIEQETGKKPVIKGWLWHQGESDGGEKAKRDAYADRQKALLQEFRNDFAEYAEDEDGKNIAYIDGMIYAGSTFLIQNADDAVALNAIKLENAKKEDNRYIVDNYANMEHTAENELKVSGDGSTQNVHYNTVDDFKLGMAYGKVIKDNGLLD